MKKITYCMVCDCNFFLKLAENDSFGFKADIVECKNCGFIFLNKQLQEKALIEFYATCYRTHKKEINNSVQYFSDRERAISQSNYIEPFIKKENNLFEIGSGWGVLSNLLFDKGYYNITTTEWDKVSNRNLNEKIVKYTGSLKDINGNFDIIIMSHVLEHLADLNIKLLLFKKILKNKGKLFIEVPNAINPLVIKNYMNGSPYHHWFFNKKCLINLLKKNGFKLLHASTFGKIKLLNELKKHELLKWKSSVKSGITEIEEISENHPKAYWIRLIVECN